MKIKKGIAFEEANAKQIKRINALAKVSADLFGANGYSQTSMGDIARAAKITKGGVYHYFESKTEILYFICTSYISLDLENLVQSLSTMNETYEKIKFIIFRHIDHYTVHSSAARTLLNEAYNLPPQYLKQVKAMERRYFDIVAQVLSEYERFRSEKYTVTALTFILFGMMNWMYSWYNPKGPLNSQRLSNLIFETFMNGMNSVSLESQGFYQMASGIQQRFQKFE